MKKNIKKHIKNITEKNEVYIYDFNQFYCFVSMSK